MRVFKTAVFAGFAALLFALPDASASAESGRFSIGGMAGWAWPTPSYAVRERGGLKHDDLELKSGGLLGGNVMYRFPSGLALDLSGYHQQMKMEDDDGTKWGTLKMTPLILSLKYYELPESGSGLGGHFGAGGGVVFSRFDKSNALRQAEQAAGVRLRMDTDPAPAFSFGGGLDYFFTENISLGISGRYLLTDIKTSGANFKASNAQALMHLRFWF